SANPIVWIIAAALWGAAGWATVPTLQQALTADRPAQAMPVIAFQMAAMYLGSAVGAAAGSGLLSGGAVAADLAGWALLPAGGALLLAGAVSLLLTRGGDPVRPAGR
ncbi:MAG: hypothetical protein L0K56_06190, partial [Corynebacterium sp.]|nr:hypothetical protein [Corynebacterium sp.]